MIRSLSPDITVKWAALSIFVLAPLSMLRCIGYNVQLGKLYSRTGRTVELNNLMRKLAQTCWHMSIPRRF